MNKLTLPLYMNLYRVAVRRLGILQEESGQDLIEYVLIGGIVALGCVAGMQSFAANVNTAFTNLGGKLTGYTS
jgi:pilus assembly protein Flp/PilA